MWKNKKRYLYLNYEETRVVLQSLVRLKNKKSFEKVDGSFKNSLEKVC